MRYVLSSFGQFDYYHRFNEDKELTTMSERVVNEHNSDGKDHMCLGP